MREYQEKKQELHCNCCGKTIAYEALIVRKKWGYFSGKDGEIHSFCICENCYDRIRAEFRIPVEAEPVQEYL